MTTTPVRVQLLTRETFAPFGEIIDPMDKPPDIETPVNRYWDGATRLACNSRAIQVGFLTAYRRPLRADWMERHLAAMVLGEASRIDDMHVVDLRQDLATEIEVLL